jgi:signal transduction histidine kinase
MTDEHMAALPQTQDELEKRVAELEQENVGHRKTERELRGKNAFFDAFVNSSLDGIFVVDPEGRTLLQNRQFVEMWKIPDEITAKKNGDALIRHIGSMIKDAAQFRREVIHLYSHPNEIIRAEVELKDGTVLDRYSSPVRDEDGKDFGRIWSFRDITQIKRLSLEIERAQKELMQASRQAGMAEVAIGVLHNVGNVLNSVGVSTSIVLDRLKNSKISSVSRVAALIRENAGDLANFLTSDSRGKQIPAFLSQLAECLENERTSMIGDTQSVQSHFEHIKQIVTLQQTYAKAGGLLEKVQAADLIEDALRMDAGAPATQNVEVIRDFNPEVSEMMVDRHQVLQILVNLIRNAKHACNDSGRAEKQLKIHLTHVDGRTRIVVSDNGIGIPPENLTRIFNHGFTTREGGHGFGLHSAALAAKQMGGQLTARSEGPQRGAAFTLELPAAPDAAH